MKEPKCNDFKSTDTSFGIQFIRRSKVMSLYRSFVRATYKIEDPQTRKETLQYFRSEFESNRGVTDSVRHHLQTLA